VRRHLAIFVLLALTPTLLVPLEAQRAEPSRPLSPLPRAPFVVTPTDVVVRMLELAGVRRGDVVYDLGCGDGRIVIEAARRFGTRGVGIDIDPARIVEAEENARRAGVADLVTFRIEDALQTDVSGASVVTLYLLSSLNVSLRPRLTRQLKRGARIVSHSFAMGDWEPDVVDSFVDASGTAQTLYLWTTDGRVRP
jgi:tRNA A58 N-methylase Trm61